MKKQRKKLALGPPGAERIAAERRRQAEEEGFGDDCDDFYTSGELVRAALSYACAAGPESRKPDEWPWPPEWWKPSGRVRNLEKAGALIAAEIDRLARAAAAPEPAGWPTHRGCTYILRGKSYSWAKAKWLRERTHGCWCSAWRETPRGLLVWRRGAWRKPEPGELRSTTRPPPELETGKGGRK